MLLLQALPKSPLTATSILELGGLALLWLVGAATGLEKIWGWVTGSQKARVAEWQAWRNKLEADVQAFMPEDDIREELRKLGVEIADNQGKIKLLHDRGEEVNNGLNMRVSALEQNHVNLSLLPQQVQKLNTDHAVLASEVRTLSHNIDRLSAKQDDHFKALMDGLQKLSYTRGQLEA